MKLLHTSDLRLGMGFPHVDQLAEGLREARLEALRSILSLAAREKVDAIVLAGNTLADNRVSHRLVMDLVALLGTSTAPVYILPGETDPLTAESPYALRAELFKPPIHILRDGPLPWSGPRVVVACGDVPKDTDAEYIAMGGIALPRQTPPAYWPGPPETFHYGQGQGQVNIVSFPGPEVRLVTTGRFNWLQKTLEVENLDLSALASDTTLMRLKLTGSATLEQLQEVVALQKRHGFYWLEVDNQLRVSGAARYQHPLLRSLHQQLTAAQGDDGGAREALLALNALVTNSGKEDLV